MPASRASKISCSTAAYTGPIGQFVCCNRSCAAASLGVQQQSCSGPRQQSRHFTSTRACWSSSSSSSSTSSSMCSKHVRQTWVSRLAVALLLIGVCTVRAAPTQCRKKTPTCPTRSDALARKPMFEKQTPNKMCLSDQGCGMLFISNDRLKVGVDTERGGAISWLSSPKMPGGWANMNLVNTWDSGRLIQQSYYGCYDETCWVDKPWRWNPVQGGSWQNGPPKLVSNSLGGSSVTVTSVPRNWGGQELLDDVLMVTETELQQNVIKVRFTMRYTGTEAHPNAHQEVPAVFLHRKLNVLALYTGNKPWTKDAITRVKPGQTGEYFKPTEHWAAYIDEGTGFGVGVYTPVSTQLVAYRVGPEKSEKRNDVSYLAPLVTANIQPHTQFSYDAYIAVGHVDEMRKWFSNIASKVQSSIKPGSYQKPLPPVA